MTRFVAHAATSAAVTQSSKRSVAVCIACYNRRAITVRCLKAVRASLLPHDLELFVYVVDDGSSDGTSEAIEAEWPAVRVIRGTGSLFWGGAMRLAMSEAMNSKHDFYLWLNDDVTLFTDSIASAVEVHDQLRARGESTLIVGSTKDTLGRTTYGGMRRLGWHPLAFRLIEPDPENVIECDTANGNFVLISAAVAAAVGNIDRRFRHRIGDVDYVLRARRMGFGCRLHSGHIGTCEANAKAAMWQNPDIGFLERWRIVCSPMGLPPKEWLLYGYRHGDLLGFCVAILHYRRMFVRESRKHKNVK